MVGGVDDGLAGLAWGRFTVPDWEVAAVVVVGAAVVVVVGAAVVVVGAAVVVVVGAAVVVVGAAVVVGAGVDSFIKRCVVYIRPPSQTTPTPMWVNSGSTMFA